MENVDHEIVHQTSFNTIYRVFNESLQLLLVPFVLCSCAHEFLYCNQFLLFIAAKNTQDSVSGRI